MVSLFDDEEKVALTETLSQTYLEKTSLTVEEFQARLRRVFSALEDSGFDKAAVGARVADRALVNLVWEPICLKAEELARASFTGGLGNLAIFGVSLVALVAGQPASLFQVLPGFVRSKVVLAIVGGGVLVGAVHAVRGYLALAAIKARRDEPAPERGTVVSVADGPSRVAPDVDADVLPGGAGRQETGGFRIVDVSGGRRRGGSWSFRAALLGLVGVATALAGALAANTALNTAQESYRRGGGWGLTLPMSILGFLGMIAAAALGALVMRGIIAVWRQPLVAVGGRAARLVVAALVCWQLAALGQLITLRVFVSREMTGIAAVVLLVVGQALSFRFAAAGSRIWATARQHMAPPVADVLAADPRPPSLYLRSFVFDTAAAPYWYSTSYRRFDPLSPLRPSYWFESRELTFEEIVCKGVASFGPVVAIGKPGEPLPMLGAARMYVPHDRWQSEVRSLVGRCRLVCLLVGSSEGVLWEFELAVERSDPQKVLLLIPQGLEYATVWGDFVERGAKEGHRARLPRSLPPRALAVAFDAGGVPVVFTGPATVGSFREIARRRLSGDV